MVILPAADAAEFTRFCELNPQPCPVLETLPAGAVEPKIIAPGADVRSDLPRYRVFRNGVPEAEPTDITALWRDDLVTFMLGCSFIAEAALMEAGLLLPHVKETGFVPMYRTTRACVPAGAFAGPLVVSMRPFTPAEAERAAEVTSHYPMAHGAPLHMGDPGALGIADLAQPEFAITHAPGHMFVADITAESTRVEL